MSAARLRLAVPFGWATRGCVRRLSSGNTAGLSEREAAQRAELSEWLRGKGVRAEVAVGVVQTLASTPGMKPNVASMKAMGSGGLKALVGAVEREQEELAEKHAGKAAVTVHVHVPHERHSFTCAAMEGDNLMEVAQAHPDLLGAYLECACGGHAACSTCHVIVDEAHFAGLPSADEAELDMVDLAYGVTDTSRLGCQIVLNADGIEITLPSGVNNHW